MDQTTIVWIVVIAVVVIAALTAWAMIARKKRLDAPRQEAAGLREKAQSGESYAETAEDRARELQGKAREAQVRADKLHTEAEEATRIAREHRDRVTGDYVNADEIDPDAKRR
ncbi:hypothetical protein [Serinicoccus profundi]|uniref:hypothetical protein n=1 Tax=Serinicoccus profundi TaxID=1078471 RepID=UPI000255E3CA|nr:hypothetical protein [Serinicoccus profundi]